ncbi:MAG: TolC family protein [Muribaculaceae bacterium]|nr:TolC family protein [Muribaculaceae bacterium]
MKLHILSLIQLFGCLAAGAQSAFAPAIRHAVDADPVIAAAEARGAAEVAGVEAENVPDGPEVDFEHLWSARPDVRNKWNIGVNQEFSLPGVYKARGRAAAAMSEGNAAARQLMRLDRALDIKLAIVDLIDAYRRLNLQMEIRGNLDRIDELTRRAFDSGNATILDSRKMQLAVLDNDNTLAAIRADIERLMATLSSMNVNIDDLTPGMLSEYPAMPLRAADYSPLERVAESRKAAAKAQSTVASRSAWPTFSLGYRHAYEDGTHFNGLGVSVRLPQWSRSKRTRAAELEAVAASFDAEADRLAFRAESDALMRQATADALNIERYRDLTSDNTYLGLLQKAFDAGQLSVIDYLTEINLFTTARLNYLELEYRQALTLTRLGRYVSEDF